MLGKWAFILVMVAVSHATPALSDELTQLVQQDLARLGYDPGPVDGHPGTKTIIAVSRFQSEHGLEVTGEITPQLAGIIQAEISKRGSGGGAGPPAEPRSHFLAFLRIPRNPSRIPGLDFARPPTKCIGLDPVRIP